MDRARRLKEFVIARLGSHDTIKMAADEIKKYLKRMDPLAAIEIRTYEKYDNSSSDILWVGLDEKLDVNLKPVEDKTLDDAIYINVKDYCGIITGANERAVLIAAYRFLKELGVKWLCPGEFGEVVPKKSLDFCDINVSEAPTTRHRDIVIEGACSYEHIYNMIDWIPKAGMNGYFFQFMTPQFFMERWYTHNRNETIRGENLDKKTYDQMYKKLVDEASKRNLIQFAVGHGWTGEPFGLGDSTGWNPIDESEIPEETRQILAMINGKRQIFGGAPGNTNLCYSNPMVVDTIAKAVANYCEKNPQVTYICVWAADARNNFCECEICRELRPFDWMINIMNSVDEELSRRDLKTRVLFLPYNDLMWKPLQNKLKNPDRFAMMFAPITRRFNTSFEDVDLENLPEDIPYALNNVTMPRTNPGVIKQIKNWDNFDVGERLIFDYHFWSTLFFSDVGGFKIADIISKDIKAYAKLNINGFHSCQVQRYSFPTNLPMQIMADTLWDSNADFDAIAEDYLKAAFGKNYKMVRDYLETLSLTTAYWNKNDEPDTLVDEEKREQNQNGLALIEKSRPIFSDIFNEDDFENDVQRMFWKLLLKHLDLAELVLKLQVRKFSGESITERYDAITELAEAYKKAEPEIHWFLDIWRQVVVLNKAKPVEDPH